MNDKIFCTEDGFAVKTLFLKSLARDLRADHLFDYFSTFGLVQDAQIHVHANNSFGFVKFQAPDAAANVLKMKHHAIDGRTVEVVIAEDCHQDETTTNDELRIESTNATGTEFMDLNDDCLRNILALVTAIDLCSLRELSEISKNIRLETITNEIFARKYKIFMKKSADKADNFERLLANFGSLILDLRVDGINDDDADSARKIESIIRWCSGTVRWLKFRNYTFGKTKAKAVLFSRLEWLHLTNCHFKDDTSNLFANCNKLISLIVTGHVPDMTAIFQHTFSRLVWFWCGDRTVAINYDLENFITRHKKLETIALYSLDDQTALLPVIARNCTKLMELELTTDGDKNPAQYKTYVKRISELKNLRELAIRNDVNAIKFIRKLNHLQGLRELHLKHVRCVSGIVTALLQLKMLEVLRICECEHFTNFAPLAELCQLKKLYITSKEVVNFDLVYMVSRLADLEMIYLKLKNFIIDEEMRFNIVRARSKSDRVKHNLEIECNYIKTHFRSSAQ